MSSQYGREGGLAARGRAGAPTDGGCARGGASTRGPPCRRARRQRGARGVARRRAQRETSMRGRGPSVASRHGFGGKSLMRSTAAGATAGRTLRSSGSRAAGAVLMAASSVGEGGRPSNMSSAVRTGARSEDCASSGYKSACPARRRRRRSLSRRRKPPPAASARRARRGAAHLARRSRGLALLLLALLENLGLRRLSHRHAQWLKRPGSPRSRAGQRSAEGGAAGRRRGDGRAREGRGGAQRVAR